MAKKRKSAKPSSLSSGRPPTLASRQARRSSNLSSQTTRTVIRKHHQLLKAHAQAIASNKTSIAEQLQKEIAANGGLEHYQAASILGQSALRGGDTSRHLLEFLAPVRPALKQISEGQDGVLGKAKSEGGLGSMRRLRMLDVGALSTDTAAGRSGLFDVTRIDLNSQEKGILQQDFMERPLPRSDDERFDIVCLSLVVNYVPDARVRGEMLKRVGKFLVEPKKYIENSTDSITRNIADGETAKDEVRIESILPALWLVLPAPCVTNSRYMDTKRLTKIMTRLGYDQINMKVTAKLAYFLYRYTDKSVNAQAFPKVEVNQGRTRNNFVIVLE